MRNITKVLIMSLLSMLSVSAFAEVKHYYWNYGGGTTQTLTTKANWSLNPDTQVNIVDDVLIDDPELNIYRMNTVTAGSTINLSSGTMNLASINNTGSATGNWHFYTGTATLTVGKIVQDQADTMTIRKSQATNAMTVNAKALEVKKGTLSFGAANDRYFVVTLNLGDSTKPTATSVDLTGGVLSIFTTKFSNDGNINISGGTMQFVKPVNTAGTGTLATSPDFIIKSGNSVNMGDNGIFRYSTYTADTSSFMDGYVDISNLNVHTSAAANAAQVLLYTKAVKTSEKYPVKVGSIVLGKTLSESETSDQSKLEFKVYDDTYIGSITSTNIGGKNADNTLEGSSDQGFYFYNYVGTTTIGSADIAVRRATFIGKTVIEGDFRNFFYASKSASTASIIDISHSSTTFEIKGNLIGDGAIVFDGGANSSKITTLSVGGISGGQNTTSNRISTDYQNNKGGTIITITGSTEETYTGRIHDYGTADTPYTYTNSQLSFVKNGTGTQYFRGAVYYRGDTTINSGALYITSNGGKSDWGIGRVLLQGGKFGVVNTTEKIGKLMATDFIWSGGTYEMDIDGLAQDRLLLSGNLERAVGYEGKFNLSINLDAYILDHTYDVMELSSGSISGIAIEDINLAINGMTLPDEVKARLFADAQGLHLMFAIPEPSTYALIFSLAAFFVAYRRKRKM